MAWTRVLMARLRALWAGDDVRDEIDEEYRFHIELRIDENIARGMSPAEARRDAERRFGNVPSIKDAGYDVRGGGMVETMWQDVRFGSRVLRKNVGFTSVAVITLALGIGATTAIFSVVDAVLLRPLPFADSDRLIMVREKKPPQFPEFSVAPGNFLEWKASTSTFDRLVALRGGSMSLTGTGDPLRVRTTSVTDGFLAMLGVQPEIGRDFLPEEMELGHGDVALLSHGLWQRNFGGDPSVLNRPITLDGKVYTVVGVMPASFAFFGTDNDIWTPLAFTAEQAQNRGGHFLAAVGKLKPGVTVAQADADVAAIAARLEAQYPNSNGGWGVKMSPLLDFMVGRVRPALLVLLGAVGFVLLIACANVANLFLARAAGRHKEVAVRVALGASRWRIVRQLLTESLLLAAAGGAVGLALAKACMVLLVRLAPANLPRLDNVSLDGRVLAFTATIALLTAVIFGLVPAFQASHADPNEVMKEGGRGSTEGGRRQLVRGSLVVLEVAAALVLLLGAGLLVRSFWRLESVDPGFDPNGGFTASMKLPDTRYKEDDQKAAFFHRLLDDVRGLPGVKAAGLSSGLPLSDNDFILAFNVQGQAPLPPGATQSTNFYAVSDGFFDAMTIPLLRGRVFNDRDTKDSPPVALINDTLAKRIFPNEDPIGQHITFNDLSDKDVAWYEIVGIVGDVKHYSLDQAAPMQTYEPYTQQTVSYMSLVAKTDGDPAALAPAVRGVVAKIDRDLPLSGIGTLDRFVATSMAQQQFSMLLLGVFAAAALLLAAVGIYGLLSYSVTQRTHEIGIRMALGAGRRDVLRFVVGQGLVLALVGIVVGLGGALALTRVISGMLFGVTATDPATFVSIVLMLVGVALVACWMPARRATKVDPLVALRHD